MYKTKKKMKFITLFRDHISLNWNLEMLLFVEGGKPILKPLGQGNNKLNPLMATGRNQSKATLKRGKLSHYCASRAPK